MRSIRGARAALLLDSEGEVVVEAGLRDERHRLIGAYQGIALATLRRLSRHYGWGGIDYLLCRYDEGSLVLRPLRDGYFLVVALGPDGGTAEALHRTDRAQALMNQEI